ncbi:MAG: hypothetical protein AAB897_00880 [Patescibacteria group bacterium]
MSKDMLGTLVRKLVNVPEEALGTLIDLSEKLAGPNGKEWLVALKHFLRKEGMAMLEVFRVTVDYSMTIEQMIAAGRYDWQNNDVNDKHFPIPPSKRGKQEVAIELIKFDRDMESNEVLRELDKMGLRSAELPELLAFGAAYPEKQREFPVVALGSVWHYWDGDRGVACLCRHAGGRYLDLRWWCGRWFSHGRFAAVSK